MCKSIVRPLEDKNKYGDNILKSGYGKDMVIVIPFNCEVRVKSICMVSGDDGEAPKEMKLYKNEEAVDISIQEDKTPLQKIDLNQNKLLCSNLAGILLLKV